MSILLWPYVIVSVETKKTGGYVGYCGKSYRFAADSCILF